MIDNFSEFIHDDFVNSGSEDIFFEDQEAQQKYQKTEEMMSVPRAVLKSNPHNNQRLQFPIQGDFGYEEPVGKKKYSSLHSPIHKIIFNHEIDTTTLNNDHLRSYSINPENKSMGPLIKQRSFSPIHQIGSRSPQQTIQKEPFKGKEDAYRYLPHKFSNLQPANLDLSHSKRPEDIQFEGQLSDLVDSRARNPRNYPGKKDSLDLLLNPLKVYEPMLNKKKEKELDAFIRYRSKNPTFLNSQL